MGGPGSRGDPASITRHDNPPGDGGLFPGHPALLALTGQLRGAAVTRIETARLGVGEGMANEEQNLNRVGTTLGLMIGGFIVVAGVAALLVALL